MVNFLKGVNFKALKKILFSKIIISAIAIVIQIVFLVGMLIYFRNYSPAFYTVSLLLSALIVIRLVNSEKNPAYKIAWIIPIMLVPILGGILYLFFVENAFSKKEKKQIRKMEEFTRAHLKEVSLPRGVELSEEARLQSHYLTSSGMYPPYVNTEVEYFRLGEDKFSSLCDELKKAEKYIFLEYFIIEEGKMWDSILDVLRAKVRQGVEVRIIYDGFGCMLTLPSGYDRKLKEYGIHCCIFNPLVPVLSGKYNTRDHRKIAVVDGRVAFTGGINLADEYINEIEKYGHWKDMAVKLEGEAVKSFAVMFITLWNGLTGDELVYADYEFQSFVESKEAKGVIQPFSDSPLDQESVGLYVYYNIIMRARRYVYITTPYLIIDSETKTMLCLAAKSGVDVRIITPHHGDKFAVHETTRSFYRELISCGVKIYEYEKGFIHGKVILADDQYAVVGSINMDYRSLFLHYECGVWMYNTPAIRSIHDDIVQTLDMSIPITFDKLGETPLPRRVLRWLLRLFAPLM